MKLAKIVAVALIVVGVLLLIPAILGNTNSIPPLGGDTNQKLVSCAIPLTNPLLGDVQFKTSPTCVVTKPSLLSCVSLSPQIAISEDVGSVRVTSGGSVLANIGYTLPEFTDSVKTFKRCVSTSTSSIEFQLVNKVGNNIGGSSFFKVSV